MIRFIQELIQRVTQGVRLSRYRVTPRHNPRVLQREMLGTILHNLNRDPGATAHG